MIFSEFPSSFNKASLLIFTLFGGATVSNGATVGFDIVLNYTGGAPGGATQAAFESAKATWESIITGYEIDDINNTDVNITVNLSAIDGPGGTLGSAGPQTAKLNSANTAVTSTYVYTQSGQMTFDTADIPGLGGTFEAVVLHEMGHVLGIGTLWSSSAVGFAGRQELYVNNSGQYTGAFGVAAYNSEFSQVGASVPVELGGGGGTANGHWNEVDGGSGPTGITSNITGQDFQFELMTGWLNSPVFISTLTTESMRDLGYTVASASAPIPEPSSALIVAFGSLALLRRKRN